MSRVHGGGGVSSTSFCRFVRVHGVGSYCRPSIPCNGRERLKATGGERKVRWTKKERVFSGNFRKIPIYCRLVVGSS